MENLCSKKIPVNNTSIFISPKNEQLRTWLILANRYSSEFYYRMVNCNGATVSGSGCENSLERSLRNTGNTDPQVCKNKAASSARWRIRKRPGNDRASNDSTVFCGENEPCLIRDHLSTSVSLYLPLRRTSWLTRARARSFRARHRDVERED